MWYTAFGAEDLPKTLARLNAGGAVAACRRLDAPLHPLGVRNGDLCCVPAFGE